jgi:hypothetical protein
MKNRSSIILAILALILMLSAFMHTESAYALPAAKPKKHDFGFTPTPIDKSIADKGDARAAEHILQVVDANLSAAPHYSFYSRGGGSAVSSFMDMSGELEYGIIFLKDNGAMYMQSGAHVTRLSSSAGEKLSNAVKGVIDQAERHYSPDGKTFYIQRVKGFKAKTKVFDRFPYSASNFSASKVEEMTKEEYCRSQCVRKDIFELSNIVMDASTIDPASVKLDRKDNLYRLSFSINLDDAGIREKATRYARGFLRSISNSDDLQFKVFKVYMEVYENGLIKKYTREESWGGTLKLGMGFRPDGVSKSANSFHFTFDPVKCKIKGNGIDTSWIK